SCLAPDGSLRRAGLGGLVLRQRGYRDGPRYEGDPARPLFDSKIFPRERDMAQAIRFSQTGGPDVLRLETLNLDEPGSGQVRVRHTYVAVNFIDIYFRTGRYPLALPNGLGSDAVGVVEAVCACVTDLKPGDRVGYLLGPQGAYADVRVLPAEVLIPLPDGVADSTAAT